MSNHHLPDTRVPGRSTMPRWIRLTKHALTLVLVLFGGLFFAAAGWPPDAISVALGAACLLAAIGLVRCLAWGRSLTSWLVVPFTFLVSTGMMGDLDDHDRRTLLTRLLGWEAPLFVQWLAVVVVATLLLSPLLAIGWRRSYFMARWW